MNMYLETVPETNFKETVLPDNETENKQIYRQVSKQKYCAIRST